MKNHTLDKEEIVEAIESLDAEIKALESAIQTAGHSLPQLEKADRTDIIATHEVLTTNAAMLRVLAKAKGVELPKLSEPSPARSGVLTDGGISTDSARSNHADSGGKKMTATEKVLAAKGVKSIEELNRANSVVPSSAKMTATEKVLAAKGVSTVEELAGTGARESYDRQRKRLGKASAITIGALLIFCGMAKAQVFPTVTLIADSTNTVAATTTNPPVLFAVSEFNDFFLTLRARGHSGTPSNVQAYVFRSIDSTDYETSPWKVLQLQLSGTATNSISTNLDVTGVGALKLVLANTNGVVITNLNAKARFKAPKVKWTS